MILDALPEYRADWVIAGKAASTVDTHVALLHRFVSDTDSQTVEEARRWITAAPTRSMQRKRAQSLRAFGRWSEQIGDNDLSWWRQIRVPVERERPQPTATAQDFSDGLQRLSEVRDRAILGVLWGAGLRRSEVARLTVADVNLPDGFLIVRTSKTGKPRVAPLPPVSARLVRRHLRKWSNDSLFGIGPDGVRLMLRRHGLLPAHAWRRGWAVESLRSGVSEASVKSAAGWSSGAMVALYTRALASDLAVAEFRRAWNFESHSDGSEDRSSRRGPHSGQ